MLASFRTSEVQKGCVPKIGRKLLLGKKLTLIVIIKSQEDGKKIHKHEDLVIWHYIDGVPKESLIPTPTRDIFSL